MKGLGHINTITIMDEVDTLDRIVLPIGVSLIEISPDVGTRLRLEFQLLFHFNDLRSQRKLNLLYVKGETAYVIRNV